MAKLKPFPYRLYQDGGGRPPRSMRLQPYRSPYPTYAELRANPRLDLKQGTPMDHPPPSTTNVFPPSSEEAARTEAHRDARNARLSSAWQGQEHEAPAVHGSPEQAREARKQHVSEAWKESR